MTRRRRWCTGLGLMVAIAGAASGSRAWSAGHRAERAATPRVIVSSDFPPLYVVPGKACKDHPKEKCSDPDDVQSMVRLLLYANELEIEGLVASAGTLANVANKENILDILDLYDAVDENLRHHDRRYPTADRLRSVTWQGRSGAWGSPSFGTPGTNVEELLGGDKDSEASDAIIRVVDRPDPRPVWFCAWGGSREVAQAIWKVRATRTAGELDRFLGKLRLFLIAKQDNTTNWLLDSFPRLFVILSEKNYMGMFWNMSGSEPKLADLEWIDVNIRRGHGPLGAYPKSGWDPAFPGQQEGDTPSFLHLVSALRGLNDPDQANQAGWGGTFVRSNPATNHWFDDPAGPRCSAGAPTRRRSSRLARTGWCRDDEERLLGAAPPHGGPAN